MLAIPKEYAAFRSAYLAGGYHADAASLVDVQIARSSVRGTFRITQRFAEPDGEPALAAHNVVLWALQLGVIYGCAQQGYAEAKDLSLREISLKCLRPVADPTQITVSLRLRFRRPVPGGIYYVGDIDVDHGAFAGRIGFTFPSD
jgi:hypothetical protein